MTKSYQVTVAPAAVWSLQDAESYKSDYIGNEQASIWADELFQSSLQAISQHPTRYRFNSTLADMGVAIRERLVIESDFRCLYDFDKETNTIEILLFVSMKQDLEKTLYRYHVLS